MLQFVSLTYYPIELKSGFSYTGDAPACQHEVGHQKGGHSFCWSCPLKAHRSNYIAHVLNLDYISIKKDKEIALEPTQSQEAATKLKLNYFCQLSKGEIINELHERGIQFISTSSTNDLETILFNTLRGIHRVPSVFFSQPLATFLDINIPSYECLPCEPLHYITNHIKNLYEELPYHLNKQEKKLFEDAAIPSFSMFTVKWKNRPENTRHTTNPKRNSRNHLQC